MTWTVVAGEAFSGVLRIRPAFLNITSPLSLRRTDAGLICMRQPSIPDLAPTSIFPVAAHGTQEDCRTARDLLLPPLARPTNRTFLTWRFEVNEGSANYARSWGTGSSASISCFSFCFTENV